MDQSVFVVVFETAFVTKILFQGSKNECKAFMRKNPELCDSCTFLQELEIA